MRKFYTLIVLALTTLAVISCKKENTYGSNGTVEFSISSASSQNLLKSASADSSDIASAIIVSITDLNGKVLYNNERVDLYNMNGTYISKPLSLVTGSYKVTQFMVVNKNSKAIYMTPVTGSAKAYLVKNPLTISFSVVKDQTTKLSPEVISTAGAMPQDFGYTTFTFNVVKTFNFLLGVFVYNNTTQNFELTTAHVTVSSDSVQTLSKDIKAVTDTFTVRDGQNRYILKVTKDGYQSWSDTLSASELKPYYSSLNKGPIKVILQKSNSTEGLIAYYPFDGNANDLGPYKKNGIAYNVTTTTDRNGNTNSAYNFNGTNSYISVANFGNILPTQEIAVSLWAKTDISSSAIAICLENTTSRFGISINYNHNGSNSIFWDFGWRKDGGDANGRLYQIGTSFDQKWHRYIFISSIAQKFMKIYKDGVLIAQKSAPLTMDSPSGYALTIGKGSNDLYFKGAIDDIKIYNRVLTNDEIAN